ncbi:MAG TPA: hypothetical protein VJC37_05405 [Planctomycetota bacterium]|nr:hypothetical protein [Planctomycetota bacterium]
MHIKNIITICLIIIIAILIGCSNNNQNTNNSDNNTFKWTVCGRVVGPVDQPIPDALVFASNGGGYQAISYGPPKVIPWRHLTEQYPTPNQRFSEPVKTDERGGFSITLNPPVGGLVIVRHPDYLQASSEINPKFLGKDNSVFIIIALESGASVTGVVTGTDGTPARNVDVGLYQRDISNNEYIRLVKTDKLGSYIIKGLPKGKYAIAAWDKHSMPCEKEVEIENDRKRVKPVTVDFALQTGGNLTVQVLNRVDDSPASGYAVYLRPKIENDFHFRATDGKNTGLDGQATFDGLEDREYWVVAVPPDQFKAIGHILPWPPFSPHRLLKGEANVTIKVDPAITVKGRIINANTSQPVRAFHIIALPDGTTFDKEYRETYGMPYETNTGAITSTSGSFVLEGLRAGKWHLQIRADGYEVTRDFPIDIPVNGLKDKLDVPIKPATGKISGTVLDAETDKPLAGIRIHAYEWDPRLFGVNSIYTISDNKGVFAFNNLISGEFSLTISAEKEGYVRAKVQYEPGKRPEVLDPLRIEYVCTLKGRYLDANGQPVPGAKIILVKGEGRGKTYHLPQTITKADGSFEITDIPKGEYFIHYHDKKEPIKFSKPGEVVSVVLK